MGLLGIASGQTRKVPPPAASPVSIGPAGGVTNLEPVILTRASLDEKVMTLRLSPRVATSIRMPEPVNSVVLGDPENFQAEHSEHEPELVTVKPVAAGPAQTNLLITTTLGHQANLRLVARLQTPVSSAVKTPVVDDALAQDNLMMLKVADQAQDLELQAADQIENMVGNSSINISAPGSSSLITAAAVSAEIKSQAIMQKMLAAMMRQEAGSVAHDNALRKRTATFAGQLQSNLTNVLQHK
jgi:type IV secretory pathway VirB9-like protein